MKLATGVALTSCITGASSSSTQLRRWAAAASRTLDTAPSRKPKRIRPLLKATRPQKSAVGKSPARVARARRGDTKKTSCPMAMAAACHTPSQNTSAPARAAQLRFIRTPPLVFGSCFGF